MGRVRNYCNAQLAYSKIEEFHVLFLDRKNALIKDEIQQRGTIDHTPVYPREVIRRALELGASALQFSCITIPPVIRPPRLPMSA